MQKRFMTLGLTLTISMLVYGTAFAGTWVDAGNGSWKVQTESGYLSNQWYQDTDGNWYFLKTDGNMAEGLYQDVDGSWYLLDWRHDGTYGRLMPSGDYNGIYVIMNEQHDGTWGRILNTNCVSSLKTMLDTGVVVQPPSQNTGKGLTPMQQAALEALDSAEHAKQVDDASVTVDTSGHPLSEQDKNIGMY